MTQYMLTVHMVEGAPVRSDEYTQKAYAQVDALNPGTAPLFEPGLDDLLARVLPTGRLRFTTDYAEIAAARVHFLCVGTPQRRGENAADTSYVFAAGASLAPHLTSDALVVGSTVTRRVTRTSAGSRPTSAQCSRSTSILRRSVAPPAFTLHASAYFATSRRVFFSPPPPTMIVGRGRDTFVGTFIVSASW